MGCVIVPVRPRVIVLLPVSMRPMLWRAAERLDEEAGVPPPGKAEVTVMPVPEAVLRWNELVASFPHLAFEQGYSWGVYRHAFGWQPLRCIFSSSDRVWGLSQCLVKEIKPCRAAVIWVPSGPLLKSNDWQAVREGVAGLFEGWRVYLRIDPPGPGSRLVVQELTRSGWRPAPCRLNSRQTIIVSLEDEEETRRGRLSGNWRHNLTRGERRGGRVVCWRGGGSVEILAELYGQMVAFKGIAPMMNEQSLRHMMRAFGSRFMVMVAHDPAGHVLAARGAGWLGTHGHDLFAATSEEGRKTYASYVTLWKLLETLREEGVRTYDLGGVDPERVPGVFNFKRGIGGTSVQRSGEWEWSNSRMLSWAVNAWVRAQAFARG